MGHLAGWPFARAARGRQVLKQPKAVGHPRTGRTVRVSLHSVGRRQATGPRPGYCGLVACPLAQRGLSSAGRATESHSVGHRFDPDRLHQLRWSSLSILRLRAFGATGSTSRLDGEAAETARRNGALAQLGERVLCKHEVTGSIPVGSTSSVGSVEATGHRPEHCGPNTGAWNGSVAQVVRAHA